MKLSGYFWIGFLCYLTASLVVVADDETDYSGDGSGAIRSFLKSFLRKTAGVDSDSVNTEERVENVTVPKFLRDLYQCWSSMDTVPQGQNLTNNTEVIENCRKAIEDDGLPDDGVLPLTMQMSDTVMTFMNKGTSKLRGRMVWLLLLFVCSKIRHVVNVPSFLVVTSCCCVYICLKRPQQYSRSRTDVCS